MQTLQDQDSLSKRALQAPLKELLETSNLQGAFESKYGGNLLPGLTSTGTQGICCHSNSNKKGKS
jgi:hypothetical protein